MCIKSPSYSLSKHIASIISPLMGQSDSFVKNSEHFISTIRDITVDPDDIMVSFDVCSLFTNVPIEEALKVISNMLVSDESLIERTPLDAGRVTELLELCLRSTYFSYQGVFYEQREGAAMGSPVSAVVANLYMQFFEEMAISSAPIKPKLWKRYVDDVFCIIKRGGENSLLSHLNSLRPSIKFTVEREEDGSLAFLDCNLHRADENKISVSVYRKPTHTDKYLHYESHHPMHVKRGVVKSLYDRARRVVTTDAGLESEKGHLNRVLLSNGYPQSFININSKERIVNARDQEEDSAPPMVVIPYVSGLSEDIRRVCSRYDIRVVFRSGLTLRSQLSNLKDKLPIQMRSGVVYNVPCSVCDKSYIGETVRRLGDRIKEHKVACTRWDTEKSAIAEHAWEEGHPVAWDETTILNSDRRRFGLVVKEALHIGTHRTPLLNRDTGLELPGCWMAAINTHAQ